MGINYKILEGLRLEGIKERMRKRLNTCVRGEAALKSQITKDVFSCDFNFLSNGSLTHDSFRAMSGREQI